MQGHVPWKFSDRDHVWCFLQLDGLLIAEGRSVMEDDEWIEGAVLGLTFRGGPRQKLFSVVLETRRGKAHAGHFLGKDIFSPPIDPGTFMICTDRQFLHWMCNSVAREEICEALMTIPGSRTRVVRVFAY